MTSLYRRRLVNINVNITVASVVAAIGGTLVIHFTRYIGVRNDDKAILMIVAAAADWVIDIVLAVGLHWMANHWPDSWSRSKTLIEKAEDVIDSSPPPGLSVIKDATHGTHLPHLPGFGADRREAAEDAARARVLQPSTNGVKVGFVRDATTLQLQRLCLSPVFYGVAMGGQWFMLNWNFARELSVAVPFAVAILITRLLHTVWLLKADPQVLQEWDDWQRQRRALDRAMSRARARKAAAAKAG
ncbi:MAG: hypothetical protein Q8L55_07645 [Phycisphaerales bacterium]|nr:hypothetical protein [Phycisphaerales bacterium]